MAGRAWPEAPSGHWPEQSRTMTIPAVQSGINLYGKLSRWY
jgi:hypothetical protein